MLLAVREALPLGLRVVKLAGEPLLHPDLPALLDALEAWNLRVALDTSGAGLTPALALRLARMQRCSVAIGLDGAYPELHDALAGRPGAFAAAVGAARLLAGLGIAPHLVSLVLRRNARETRAMVRLAEELGAPSLRFVAPGSGLPLPDGQAAELLTVEELIAVGRRVERQLTRETNLRLLFDQPPAFRGLHDPLTIDGRGRCSFLRTVGLLPGGLYALCGAASAGRAPDLVFGPAAPGTLERIWRGHPTLAMLRAGMPYQLQGVCERCVMKTACMGNCAAENYLRTGAFWGPYWFCEAAEKAGLFPAGRLLENRW
jgi:SynChlorMet cassette radical SAM/SPASM protein ScmF